MLSLGLLAEPKPMDPDGPAGRPDRSADAPATKNVGDAEDEIDVPSMRVATLSALAIAKVWRWPLRFSANMAMTDDGRSSARLPTTLLAYGPWKGRPVI